MKKKLGVIGGMGPEATSYYFEEVVAHTKAEKDQEHIDMVILNHATLPDRTQAILSGNVEEFIEKFIKNAEILKELGVENIAIPCNTSHYFYDTLQKAVDVPIIHMIRETIQHAIEQKPGIKKIGILATNGTIQSGVYHRECEALNVEPLTPAEENQQAVMSLIYDDIKKGQPADPAKFQQAYDDLIAQGADAVILACTELSVFKKNHPVPENVIDAMDVLVKESITRSNATYQ